LEPLLSRDGFRGIDRIIPFGLRRWKKNLFSLTTWKEFFSFRETLQSTTYDVLIETQGLLKSASVCLLTKKSSEVVVAGLANATEFSGYEPLVRIFYSQSVQVPTQCHAVDRSRWVMCSALSWPLIERGDTPQFYPSGFIADIPRSSVDGFSAPYVLCFHSTARESKRWSNEHWIAFGKELSLRGYQLVFPWGSASEKSISELLALHIPNAFVPPAFSIEQAFSVIAGAALTVGVDTGLTHLAAVLNRPTVEIYCDSPRWKTEGYWSDHIANVGDIYAQPSATEVLHASLKLLQEA
jgi:heptosyltransferase-1